MAILIRKRLREFLKMNKCIIVLSIITSLLMVLTTFLFQNILIFQVVEDKTSFCGNIIKNIVFNQHSDISSYNFLFVNTSKSNALVQNNQPPFDNNVIVDRYQLTQFLNYLKERQLYRYIIADIVFEQPSESDSQLQSAIDGLPRFITCFVSGSKDHIQAPVISANCGLCEIETIGGTFYKYKLNSYKDIESIPLKVFNELSSIDHSNKAKRFAIKLNSFVLNQRIRNYKIENKAFMKVDLCEMVFLGKEVVEEFARNRVIIIGDFEGNDQVSTAIGEVPGPLILTNALLALYEGDNIVSLLKLFILWLSFFLFSFLAYYPNDILQNYLIRISKSKWYLILIIKGIGLGSLLLICSLVYFVVLDIYLNIVYLGVIFLVINFFAKNIRKFKKTD